VYVFTGPAGLGAGMFGVLGTVPGKKGFVQVRKIIPVLITKANCLIRFFIIRLLKTKYRP